MTIIDYPAMNVNKCWQGRRFRTTEFKNWQKNISLIMKANYKGEIYDKEPLEIILNFYVKRLYSGDTDNLIKAVIDCIKYCKIIKDDRYFIKITAEKIKSDKNYFGFEIRRYEQ